MAFMRHLLRAVRGRGKMGTMIRNWLKASRLMSQSYLFLPLLLGQTAAAAVHDIWHWPVFVAVHLFGICLQLYIVYANDCADVDTDRANRSFTMFSGGSRVLVDGLISPRSLRRAAGVMAGLSLLTASWTALFYDRPILVPLACFSLLLLWGYSYAPFRLSYRGGGEVLQMLGVGLVLPLFGFYAHGGTLAGFPWELLAVLLPINLACGMATSLPDEPSDRAGRKRTSSVLLGQVNTKIVIVVLNAAAAAVLLWGVMDGLPVPTPLFLLPVILLPPMLFFLRSRPGSPGLNAFVTLAVSYTLLATVLMTVHLRYGN